VPVIPATLEVEAGGSTAQDPESKIKNNYWGRGSNGGALVVIEGGRRGKGRELSVDWPMLGGESEETSSIWTW
jgi:hypothetical protein